MFMWHILWCAKAPEQQGPQVVGGGVAAGLWLHWMGGSQCPLCAALDEWPGSGGGG